MASKQITQEDLLRMKNEIIKEDTERRHEDRRKAQIQECVVDDLKTENALLKQSQSIMSDNLKEIKNSQKEMIWKMDLFISKANETFVTKQEHQESHQENKTKIARLEIAIVIFLISVSGYFLNLFSSHYFK